MKSNKAIGKKKNSLTSAAAFVLSIAVCLAFSGAYVLNAETVNTELPASIERAGETGAEAVENLYPAWSPDGRFIAFTSNRAGNYDIYIIRTDGTGLQRLTTNAAIDAHPAWSPDGKFLSFDSQRDGNRETYLMAADGSNQRNLSRNPANDGGGNWSPDGKKLVFDSDREKDDEVFVMNHDGSEIRRVTSSPKQDQAPSWFPDGKKLVFESRRDGNREIYVMRADGTGQKNLTKHEAPDFLPAVSPDGKKIAFFSRRDGNEEIYVMNEDGSDLRRLTENAANDRMPRWSPDGKQIVFSSNRNGAYDLYTMSVDGRNEKRLTFTEEKSEQTKAADFSELEKIIEAEIAATKTPGASVAIVSGDKVLFAKGFGTTSAEGGSSVTADTLFRMGSTTKMFTAAALLSQADAGKIKLDAPIGNYIKNLPPRIAALTAHQFLSQSSGLRDFNPLASGNDDAVLGQNIRLWKEDVFFTEPNKIYSYSSANYWLAGFLTEELSGKSYTDALAEIIFKPLGMTRSTISPLIAMTYPLALGHAVQNGNAAVVRPIDNNVGKYPGGSMFSSVNELARFAVAMMNGGRIDGKQAIAPSVVEQLQKPQFYLPGEEKAFYGYGLLGFEQQGVKTVSHGGASRGYGSFITFAPEQKIAVIVLANTSGQTLPKTRQKAMEMLLPLKPAPSEPPKTIAVNAEEMKRYTGKFAHAPQTWEVLTKDGKLFLKENDKEFELKPSGKNEFSYEQGGILFVPNASGEFEHIFMGLYAARRVNQTSFNYLKFDGHRVETAHSLEYKIQVSDTFAFLGKTNHQPVFDGKRFNVSLAAFSKDDVFLMIHAETHTDGSGGLDYSNLQPDTLSGLKFTSRAQCAELKPEDLAGEHDLNFLKSKGFNPVPAIYIKQYFTTSKNGTAEIVITYGRRISGCTGKDVTEAFKAEINKESQNAVKITSPVSAFGGQKSSKMLSR